MADHHSVIRVARIGLSSQFRCDVNGTREMVMEAENVGIPTEYEWVRGVKDHSVARP